MMGKVIAVANMKGGVGKTATVVGLAEALAAATQKNVLVIDFDAQANASLCLGGDQVLAKLIGENRTIEVSIENYFLGDKSIPFEHCIRPQISNVTHFGQQLPVALLASSPKLRNLEYKLIHELTRQKLSWNQIADGLWGMIAGQLKETKNDYAYVLIDCAPGISILTEASVRLADLVIVPTIPDFLSTFGLQSFCHTVLNGGTLDQVAKRKRKRLPRVLITRRRNVQEHWKTIEQVRNEQKFNPASFKVFDAEIPECIDVPKALRKIDPKTSPTFVEKWRQRVLPVLESLAQETQETLDGARD
jgi:cellulose biosynthesis protein BcsQ